jgi:hypothetical protein
MGLSLVTSFLVHWLDRGHCLGTRSGICGQLRAERYVRENVLDLDMRLYEREKFEET